MDMEKNFLGRRILACALCAVLAIGSACMVAGCSSSGQDATSEITDGVPADGSYTIEVGFEGGSGRASIESPADLEVEDGVMTATIVWSSSNYDLMVVDGVELTPTTIDPASTFEMNVSALDEALDVQAETTAMSQPYLIDYTFTFDSSTLKYR